MKIYNYDDDGYYCGSKNARYDPKELKNGNQVWLMPRNSTQIEPPTVPEGQRAKFEAGSWSLEDLPPDNFIVITTSKKINYRELTKAVRLQYNGVRITGENWEVEVSKDITFTGLSSIPANQIALNAILTDHDYDQISADDVARRKDFDQMTKRERAAILTILDMASIAEATFRVNYATKYDSL